MQVYRCQCGKCEYYGSGMSPQECEGCESCGTNFLKKPLAPHDWKPQFDRNTGAPARPVCRRCHKADRNWKVGE